MIFCKIIKLIYNTSYIGQKLLLSQIANSRFIALFISFFVFRDLKMWPGDTFTISSPNKNIDL